MKTLLLSILLLLQINNPTPNIKSYWATSNEALVIWDPIPNASGYILKYREDGTKTWTSIVIPNSDTISDVEYNITGLEPSGSYNMDIQAYYKSLSDTSIGSYYLPNYTWKAIFTYPSDLDSLTKIKKHK